MMKEVYPFSDNLLYQVTLPYQTGSIAGMIGCGVSLLHALHCARS